MYRNIKGTLVQLERVAEVVTKFTTNLKAVNERSNQKDNVAGAIWNDALAVSSIKVI